MTCFGAFELCFHDTQRLPGGKDGFAVLDGEGWVVSYRDVDIGETVGCLDQRTAAPDMIAGGYRAIGDFQVL